LIISSSKIDKKITLMQFTYL